MGCPGPDTVLSSFLLGGAVFGLIIVAAQLLLVALMGRFLAVALRWIAAEWRKVVVGVS